MNSSTVEIRRAEEADLASARQLAVEVMSQVYVHLLVGVTLVPDDLERWRHGWEALLDERIVGVGLAEQDRVSDLWLDAASRGRNLGSRLLACLEDDIRSRGYSEARLRVVAENEAAIGFYIARGWREIERFAHEKLNFEMVVMRKPLG